VREAAAAVVLRVVRLRRGGDGGLVLRRVLLQRRRRAAPVQLQALRTSPPCGRWARSQDASAAALAGRCVHIV
jgi:hypothetical protein